LEGEAPALPGADWHRVTPLLSGICGSDLSTLDGRSSRYFEALVSFPFVPGHEIVGVLESGERVVIQPVLGCKVRHIEPMCTACSEGRTGDCQQLTFGHLRPGLQTGFCADTGGGWSAAGLVAHESQIHVVPDGMSDEDAVTVEPVACAVHAVLSAGIRAGDSVAVLGAGTLGLLSVAAVVHLSATGRVALPDSVLVGARYEHQRQLAMKFGASDALAPDQLPRAVRRRSRSLQVGGAGAGAERLTGGADVVLDCVGSSQSIEQSLAMVRPGGRIILIGMPGSVHVDLAPLWHRGVSLTGSYAYGADTFQLALEVAGAMHTGDLVSATYPLERFEEAIAHAGSAGRKGAVKIAFDLRQTSRKEHA
jgi:threonine dehydrogenase-like Zn-dependent dehydrogenase